MDIEYPQRDNRWHNLDGRLYRWIGERLVILQFEGTLNDRRWYGEAHGPGQHPSGPGWDISPYTGWATKLNALNAANAWLNSKHALIGCTCEHGECWDQWQVELEEQARQEEYNLHRSNPI
jgi:hypothetical protein